MAVLNFTTLDVFTDTRYLGNPLAVVHIPQDTTLTQAERQKIANEFNLSETVFVIENPDGLIHSQTVKIHIHTALRELPFAGHPTIGTSFHLLTSTPAPTSQSTSDQLQTTLDTLAGNIPVVHDLTTSLTRLEVPHAISFYNPLPLSHASKILGLDPASASTDLIPNAPDGAKDTVATACIVDGMPFVLIRVASLDVLSRVHPAGIKVEATEVGIPDPTAKDLASYIYFVEGEDVEGGRKTTRIRSRMFFRGVSEDPATGSGASCLSGYLSITKGEGLEVETYVITQGVEMGRKSDIRVEVKPKVVDGSRKVETMWLSGKAVETMHGTLTV